MTTKIKLLNKNFEATKNELDLNIDLSPKSINVATIAQVVNAIRAGKRQGTACTKNRALVSGGGSKPFKQKGTGRARQGSSRSPVLVGGGTVFGPTPRDYTQKLNKKIKLNAIRSVLADKLQAGKLLVVDTLESSGKTKEMAKLLGERNIESLFLVTNNKDSLALRAVKNLKRGFGLPVESFSVYQALRQEYLVIEKEALEKLVSRVEQ